MRDGSITGANSAGIWRRAGGMEILALAVVLAVPVATLAAPLDAVLHEQMPQVVHYLKAHGYRNVAVLRFRVKKGDGPASDNVGLLNRNLAGRLEIALVLAGDDDDSLGVIRDADAVAAGLPGVNHLTRPGRQALFRGRYPLAWGEQGVVPDVFLTGVAVLSPDLKQMTVALLAFDREGAALDKVTQFTATTDPATLAEAGESFLVRGAFDSGRTEEVHAAVVASAARVNQAKSANPMADASAPVSLKVRYDDQTVPVEIRGGRAMVREPGEGQRVSLVLNKVDRTPDRYGVVLLVNNENTLFREHLAPLQAKKWILSPDHRETVIRGYQTGNRDAEAFRVLSREASRSNVVHYGPQAGTITMVVYRERSRADPIEAAPPEDAAEDLAAISRGVLPTERPRSREDLRNLLRGVPARRLTRGLIVQGERVEAAIERVDFAVESVPVMSATITYYSP